MSMLKASELRDYRVLLAKYGYQETDFVLNEENLRMTADGGLRGTLWIMYLRIDRRLACDLGSSPPLASGIREFATNEHLPVRSRVGACEH